MHPLFQEIPELTNNFRLGDYFEKSTAAFFWCSPHLHSTISSGRTWPLEAFELNFWVRVDLTCKYVLQYDHLPDSLAIIFMW